MNDTKFKNSYTAFVRDILGEVMSEDELRALDKKYTEAKLIRAKRRIEKQAEKAQEVPF